MKKVLLLLSCFFGVSMMSMSQVDTVIFSAHGGFYEEVFQLELFNYYSQNHIRYTVNGNTPDANSPLYTGSLTLDSALYSPSNIYTIVNTIPSLFYLADDVQRAIVIRAAVFDQNENRICEPATQTYFIHALGCDFHGLPVVSLVADSLSLFDYYTGIFVPGVNYDPADSISTGNYKMKGDEWERTINAEFYELDNEGINQICGLRTHGGASRWLQQKGMKLYAREEYGKKRFVHTFFNTTMINSFKHLCLHPFRCSNWLQTGGQEYLSHRIARNLNMDALAVREVVVFLNGEYWGIYTMEESPDERWVENHYDVDFEDIVMVKYWGVPYYGDPTEWRNLFRWFETADLSQPEDSTYAWQHVDVSNFLDYMLFETFSANLDWPANNVKIWQPGPGGKFRWLFYDGDGCFTRPHFNAIEHAINQGLSSRVFVHFRENSSFLKAFRDRYFELCESFFSYNYMKSVLDEYGQLVEGEIEAQSRRFRFPVSVTRWNNDMARADEFLSQRDSYFRQELDTYSGAEEYLAQNENALWCYPNPSSEEIHVAMNAEPIGGEIAIYDMMGKKVFATSFAGAETVTTIQPQLAAGVYLLKAGRHTQRIVRY